MNMQVYCNDLYDLNSENTYMYDEHKKWYNESRAASVGDLLDKQQDMIDSYKRAVNTSTQEIADLKSELTGLRSLVETMTQNEKKLLGERLVSENMIDSYKRAVNTSTDEIDELKAEIAYMKESIESAVKLHQLVTALTSESTSE